tara:strand:- start:1151 stop:2032 length:882 start_codon:yes stop_codon:yes gene_type:complete
MPKRTKLDQDLKAVYGFAPSRVEDIDFAIFNYVNDSLNVFCESNDGFKKVPVIFAGAERAYQVKNESELRKDGRTLEYPIISIVRTSLTKNPENKGRYGVYLPPYFDFYKKGGAIPIARKVQQEKTRDRANATAIKRFGNGTNSTYQTFPFDNKKVVYETLFVPTPTFIEMVYEVKLISSYQQQMNEMLSPFLSRFSTPAVFNISHEGHVYEAFVDPTFGNESNNAGLETNERVFKSTITIKVLGHIIGSDKNQDTPAVVVREGAAEVTIGRERAIVGDEPDFSAGRKDKYRG